VDVAVLRLLALVVAVAATAAAGAALPGCFSPRQPGCAFSCAADGICPADYTCGDDGFCHRDDGQGFCTLTPQNDAAQDAGDAGVDDAAVD
jgi:hypothetical protein